MEGVIWKCLACIMCTNNLKGTFGWKEEEVTGGWQDLVLEKGSTAVWRRAGDMRVPHTVGRVDTGGHLLFLPLSIYSPFVSW